MQEVSQQAIAELPLNTNVTDLVLQRLDEAPQLPVYALAQHENDTISWQDVTMAEFVDQVRNIAKGLIYAGIKPGDGVIIMASTSYQWALMDQAVWFAGGVSTAIYETSSAFQAEHIIGDSGASLIFVETDRQAAVIDEALKSLGSQDIPVHRMGTTQTLLDFAAPAQSQVSDATLERARTTATLDDVASLVYTSGTTGRPKGAKITHGNLCLTTLNILPFAQDIVYPEGPNAAQSSSLMFLPLAHILARAVQYICLIGGIKIGHVGDLKYLLPALSSFNPSFVLAVPRVFEKVLAGAQEKAETGGKGKIFAQAKKVAIAYARAQEYAERGQGSGPGLGLKIQHAVFDKLVYSKIRDLLGDRAKYSVSGASTLNRELGYFFRGVGIGMQEGYGLTETTAPATLNIPGKTKMGSVGLPLPGVEVKIADDGEILIRGIVVFDGYHGDQFSSEETFTSDGFLRTGDLGELDQEGFLTILGRKKELIVTAGGKNVYPTPMEEDLRTDQLIAHVVMVGDDRPFVAALIALDPEQLPSWAQRNGLSEMSYQQATEHPRVLEHIQLCLDRANEKVSRAESIREFRVIPVPLTEETGHLTPSMKLQRGKVTDDFAPLVADIYGQA